MSLGDDCGEWQSLLSRSERVSLGGLTFIPYDAYLSAAVDTDDCFRKTMMDESGGSSFPPAFSLNRAARRRNRRSQ